jgi:hypothetical protein
VYYMRRRPKNWTKLRDHSTCIPDVVVHVLVLGSYSTLVEHCFTTCM